MWICAEPPTPEFGLVSIFEVSDNEPTMRSGRVMLGRVYVSMASRRCGTETGLSITGMSVDRIDVLIITALPEELAAARAAGLADGSGGPGVGRWEERDAGGTVPFLRGVYVTRDGRRLSVALARPTAMGGRETGPFAATLTDRLQPSCVAMCGVCAGNPTGTALGDVIIAEPVYAWDEGKRSATGFEGDYRQFRLHPELLRPAQEFGPTALPSYGGTDEEAAKWWMLERLRLRQDPRKHPARGRYFPESTWRPRLARWEADGLISRGDAGLLSLTSEGTALAERRSYDDVDPVRRLPFHVRVAPMASGNAVVADPAIWGQLASMGMRKIAAVEMEAATIATVAHARQVPFCLIVKGVMDHADANKDDRYKAFAGRASAEVLFALLERLPDMPRASIARAGASAVSVHTVLPPIHEFTGRDSEIHAVTTRLAEAARTGQVVAIHAIDGMPGIGKTALATHLWHLLANRFTERLFVDLHAHTSGLVPADPADVLASLLRIIGLDPRDLPDGLEQRTAMWRKWMADQRVLLVLDNAASSVQVNPLLPGSPHSLVLITSRRRLGDLTTRPIDMSLDALTPDDAARLFVRLAPRAADDPNGVVDVVALCQHLPLAIRLVAGLYQKHQLWTIADLIDTTKARLLAIRVEHQTLAAAFDLSYQYLTPEEQRFFRTLSLHPGVEFDPYAAAALTGLSTAQVSDHLEILFGNHLLIEQGYERYRMHDLIAEYARARAAGDPADQRAQAVEQLLDYYGNATAIADARLARHTRPLNGSRPVAKTPTPDLSEYTAAVRWLRTERANILACLNHAEDHHQPTLVVALTTGLTALLQLDGPWAQAIDLHTRALDVCRDQGDRLGQANVLHEIGTLRRLADDHPGATQAQQQALDLYRDLGNRLGQANVLYELGTLRRLADDYPGATQAQQQALDLYRGLGNRLGQANVLNHLGQIQHLTGDYSGASQTLQQALSIYKELGDPAGEAGALFELGSVRYMTYDYPGALRAQERALSIFKELDDRLGQAGAHYELGRVRAKTGDYPRAVEAQEEALDLFQALQSRLGQAGARHELGIIRRLSGDYLEAIHDQQQALSIYRDLGNRLGQANVLHERGIVQRMRGDYLEAADAQRQALTICQELGNRPGEVEVLNEIGELSRVSGDLAQAVRRHEQALILARQIGSEGDEAHALAGLGRCALVARHPSEALQHLRQARDIFKRLRTSEAASIATEVTEIEVQQHPR
jgi:tetratricopeptide (TPR) repeat protein/nucleoside phosphorylase